MLVPALIVAAVFGFVILSVIKLNKKTLAEGSPIRSLPPSYNFEIPRGDAPPPSEEELKAAREEMKRDGLL